MSEPDHGFDYAASWRRTAFRGHAEGCDWGRCVDGCAMPRPVPGTIDVRGSMLGGLPPAGERLMDLVGATPLIPPPSTVVTDGLVALARASWRAAVAGARASGRLASALATRVRALRERARDRRARARAARGWDGGGISGGCGRA